jgi:tetratricopeptide (TPR) repeat protein
MTKYLLSKLSILLSAIALTSTPLLTLAAPDSSQTQAAQPTLASLDATLQQNPKDLDAYLQRGILHARLQQNIPAIADYTEVIRLDPNNIVAYSNRANAKVNMQDYQGAYLDYSQVLRIEPERAIAYNNRAFARHQLGDCKGAISDLKIAVELYRIMGDSNGYQSALANLKKFQRKK